MRPNSRHCVFLAFRSRTVCLTISWQDWNYSDKYSWKTLISLHASFSYGTRRFNPVVKLNSTMRQLKKDNETKDSSKKFLGSYNHELPFCLPVCVIFTSTISCSGRRWFGHAPAHGVHEEFLYLCMFVLELPGNIPSESSAICKYRAKCLHCQRQRRVFRRAVHETQ